MRASSQSRAPQPSWLAATSERVAAQRLLVESLPPGSRAHRTAVELLLMYQDSLHVLTEASELLTALRRGRPRS